MSKEGQDIIIEVFSILAITTLLAILAYYIVTAGYGTGTPYVSVLNFSQPLGPLKVTSINYSFDPGTGQLQLAFQLRNNGSSPIEYQGGCTSPFRGVVLPVYTANVTVIKGVASCDVITQNVLLPGANGAAVWPYSPSIITVLGSGEFNVNLTLYFGYASKVPGISCVRGNCSGPVYAANGTYSRERINVVLSSYR
jgi:hypothetical protein